ncbi:MAG: glycosyltransferase [Actinobacteria bacterium]|nr:glycosyltransferase [Actinomycetota bacterium]
MALDGCTDGTADAVARHRDRDARVVLLDLPKLGKGGVIQEGFGYCDGAFVGFVDADAATPPEEFAAYFAIALPAVGAAGAGVDTVGAFSLMVANFSVHVRALVANLLRRPSGFTVTPKEGEAGPQPRAVWPALALIAVLTGTSVYGLIVERSPATLNNVAFAALHVAVLTRGVLPALRPPRPALLETTVAADLVSGEAVAGEAR